MTVFSGRLGLLRLWLAQPDVQLAQLLFVDRVRRMREQALGALSLGKRDQVPDGLSARHERRDAVQPECDATVRWRSVLQRLQKKSELRLRLLGSDLERA